MKNVLICLFLICVCLSPAQAEERFNEANVDSILGDKVVLCEIAFLPDSYTLSKQAKTVLDRVVGQLSKVDTDTKIIRIEGFFSRDDTGTATTRLSMLRALAIEDYLRIKHAASFERFLTGHNVSAANCRAEITVYNNPWQVDSEPVNITDRGKIDGPS